MNQRSPAIVGIILALPPLLWHWGQVQLPWLTAPWDSIALTTSSWQRYPPSGLPNILLSSSTIILPTTWLPLALALLLSWFRLWGIEGNRCLAKGLAVGGIGLLGASLAGPTDWSCLVASIVGLNLGTRRPASSLLGKTSFAAATIAMLGVLAATSLFASNLALSQGIALILGLVLSLVEPPQRRQASPKANGPKT